MRGFLDFVSLTFHREFARRPMHFFGNAGAHIFFGGTFLRRRILWDKFDSIFVFEDPAQRDVTEQPMFHLGAGR